MFKITLILHDIRSTHNVGSILRTAECMGVDKVYFTGYTPYPLSKDDSRLPHLSTKLTAQIHKTALGAENMISSEYSDDLVKLIRSLKSQRVSVVALEQDPSSTTLNTFIIKNDVAIIVGNELTGIDKPILSLVDKILEIPLSGEKESLNVSQATAMCLYHLRFVGQ